MSSKTIAIGLLGVVVIGGALYFAMSKRAGDTTSLTNTTQEKASEQMTLEPTKEASSDAIVDYLVDGQSSEETKAAEATIQTTNPQIEVNTTINSNY